jgi:hypothetical protein
MPPPTIAERSLFFDMVHFSFVVGEVVGEVVGGALATTGTRVIVTSS